MRLARPSAKPTDAATDGNVRIGVSRGRGARPPYARATPTSLSRSCLRESYTDHATRHRGRRDGCSSFRDHRDGPDRSSRNCRAEAPGRDIRAHASRSRGRDAASWPRWAPATCFTTWVPATAASRSRRPSGTAPAAWAWTSTPSASRKPTTMPRSAGVDDKVKFIQGDLFQQDLSQATVITPLPAARVEPEAAAEALEAQTRHAHRLA